MTAISLDQIIDSTIENSKKHPSEISECSNISNTDYSYKIEELATFAAMQKEAEQLKWQNFKKRTIIKMGGSMIVGIFNIPLGFFTFCGSMMYEITQVKPSLHSGVLKEFYCFWKVKPDLRGDHALNQFLENLQKESDLDIYHPNEQQIRDYTKRYTPIGYWQAKLNLVVEHIRREIKARIAAEERRKEGGYEIRDY